jgi:hypothetical protein
MQCAGQTRVRPRRCRHERRRCRGCKQPYERPASSAALANLSSFSIETQPLSTWPGPRYTRAVQGARLDKATYTQFPKQMGRAPHPLPPALPRCPPQSPPQSRAAPAQHRPPFGRQPPRKPVPWEPELGLPQDQAEAEPRQQAAAAAAQLRPGALPLRAQPVRSAVTTAEQAHTQNAAKHAVRPLVRLARTRAPHLP